MVVSANSFLLLTRPRPLQIKFFLTNVVTLKPLTLFQPKIRATKLHKKALKFVLLGNYFPGLFTEVQIWYWKLFKFGLGRFFRKSKQIPPKI